MTDKQLSILNINDIHLITYDSQFTSLFKQIRIYGSIKDPYFVANDVSEKLNIKNFHIKIKEFMEEGVHYIIHTIQTEGGLQKSILLNEVGMYQMLFLSDSPTARKFCQYIVIVMRELRTKGYVTLEESLKQLQEKLQESEISRIRAENSSDDLYNKLGDSKIMEMKHFGQVQLLTSEAQRLNFEANANSFTIMKMNDPEYIDLLEQTFMKSVNIYNVTKYNKTHQLDEEQVDEQVDEEIELDDPNEQENEVFTFKLSKDKLIRGTIFVTEVPMINPSVQIKELSSNLTTTLSDLKEEIHKSNLEILRGKKHKPIHLSSKE